MIRLIKRLTGFHKVLKNIQKELDEKEKQRLQYLEENPSKGEALKKDKEEEDEVIKGTRKVHFLQTLRQLWFLLKGIRRNLIPMFILMFVQSLLGLFSVAALIPFLLFIQNSKYIASGLDIDGLKNYQKVIIEFSQFLYDKFELTSVNILLVIYAIAFIFVFLAKSVFDMYLVYKRTLYSNNATRHFSGKIFSEMMYISYTYYLGRSASRSMYALGLASSCYGIINGMLDMLTGLLQLFLFGFGITLLSPGAMVVLIGVFCIGLLVYLATHKELKRISELQLHLGRESGINVYQGIHNFTFSRLFHAEPFFLRIFNKFIDYNIPIGAYQTILKNFPKLSIENLLVAGMVGYATFVVIRVPEAADDIIIGAIAIGYIAFRITPILMRLISYMGTFVGDQISIDEFYKEYITAASHRVDSGEHEKASPLPFEDKIEVKNISFAYPEFDKKGINYSYENSPKVLNDISFEIKKGEKIGIIGGSGGGKTTFMHLLMSFLEPMDGDILVDGKSIFSEMRKWHKNIGYVPQDTMLLSSTVLENIAFGEDIDDIDVERVITCLKQAHLWDVVDAMPLGIKTNIGDAGKRLSGGQRQRLGIARALYRQPNVLFFDEATSHLDQETEKEVQKAIDEIEGKTVIIVAHRLNTLKKCDKILCFEGGKVVFEGSYRKMMKKYG